MPTALSSMRHWMRTNTPLNVRRIDKTIRQRVEIIEIGQYCEFPICCTTYSPTLRFFRRDKSACSFSDRTLPVGILSMVDAVDLLRKLKT